MALAGSENLRHALSSRPVYVPRLERVCHAASCGVVNLRLSGLDRPEGRPVSRILMCRIEPPKSRAEVLREVVLRSANVQAQVPRTSESKRQTNGGVC